jgi:hypothetical protein
VPDEAKDEKETEGDWECAFLSFGESCFWLSQLDLCVSTAAQSGGRGALSGTASDASMWKMVRALFGTSSSNNQPTNRFFNPAPGGLAM